MYVCATWKSLVSPQTSHKLYNKNYNHVQPVQVDTTHYMLDKNYYWTAMLATPRSDDLCNYIMASNMMREPIVCESSSADPSSVT